MDGGKAYRARVDYAQWADPRKFRKSGENRPATALLLL
jgi:hypothetical protein